MKNNAQVFHLDLYGKREDKYRFLQENSINSITWNKLEPNEPNFFFVKKDNEGVEEYEKGFKVNLLFPLNASGIKTQRDDASIKFTQRECEDIKTDFLTLDNDALVRKYGFKDVRDWTVNGAKNDLKTNEIIARCIAFRPFDTRSMNFTGKTKGVMGYPRLDVMIHFIRSTNIGLLIPRQAITELFGFFVTDKICDINYTGSAGQFGAGLLFPLYLFPDPQSQDIFSSPNRVPNLNLEIVASIARGLGLTFEGHPEEPFVSGKSAGVFTPIDLLDYIYAVLHSPAYREKYKEFLKIDFPRVPYPTDVEQFWRLVSLGAELRNLHLLESPKLEDFITGYPVDGDNVVEKPQYKEGNVYINDTQYFSNVPEAAWNFYIGGYQPAQKWLKDRKGRELSYEDILHYQKVVVALSETGRVMGEVDEVFK